jgi:hypothetical protein
MVQRCDGADRSQATEHGLKELKMICYSDGDRTQDWARLVHIIRPPPAGGTATDSLCIRFLREVRRMLQEGKTPTGAVIPPALRDVLTDWERSTGQAWAAALVAAGHIGMSLYMSLDQSLEEAELDKAKMFTHLENSNKRRRTNFGPFGDPTGGLEPTVDGQSSRRARLHYARAVVKFAQKDVKDSRSIVIVIV